MMDNYDENIINNAMSQGLDTLKIVKLPEMNDLTTLKDQQQNFNFGAEILATELLNVNAKQQHQQQHETCLIMNEIAVEQQQVLRDETKNICVNEQQQLKTQTNIEIKTKTEKIVDKQTEEKFDEQITTSDESIGNIEDDDDSENDNENENDGVTAAAHYYQRNISNLIHQADDQNSDETTSDSDFSDISGLSDVSGREWKPASTRPLNWVQKQIHSGADPREILSQILPGSAHQIAPGINDMTLWRILASMLSEPPRRQKLRYINTFEDVVQLVRQSKNIIVLTGAGVSVSCGIPDFRSSDGIYSRLAKDYPDLPDPQAMFDINYFSRDPRPFYKFAREIYPGQFKPSPCHRFIKLLEDKNKLLRNYTQNIDTLEEVAGIRNVIECHGSFSTASCTKCKYKCDADAIRADIFAQRIPACPICQPNVQQSVDASEPVSQFELRQLVENGIMKPDIVFFGEGLPEEFHTVMASDKDKCDLLIVMGSSLKVRPVALIPSSIPSKVPQILINREQLHHLEFDVELLGDSDVIINQLCHCLGTDWQDICYDNTVLKECQELLPKNLINIKDDGMDLHDVDTQSIKSNSSNDLGLRSTGTYSDSGFESSTSSNVANDIKNINVANTSAGADCLPPELLEGPNEFHTFAERLAPPSCDNYRHYSVDSTKDSGIGQFCGESSNSSALTATNFGNDNVVGTTQMLNPNTMASAHNIKTTIPTPTISPVSSNEKKMTIPGCSSNITNVLQTKGTQQKLQRLSAAERLPGGCYYSHESSASYVFPGAQVTWCSDTEDDEENNGAQRGNNVDSEHLNSDDTEVDYDEKEDTSLTQDPDDTCEDEDEDGENNDDCDNDDDDETQELPFKYDNDGAIKKHLQLADATTVDEELVDTITTTTTTTNNNNNKNPHTKTTTTTTVTNTCIKRHSNEFAEESTTKSTITTTTTTRNNCLNNEESLNKRTSTTQPPNKKRRNSDNVDNLPTTFRPAELPIATNSSTSIQTMAVNLLSSHSSHSANSTTTTNNNNLCFLNTSLEPPETLLQPH